MANKHGWSENELDRTLHDAGRAWREAQPPAPEPTWRDGTRWRHSTGGLGAAAGVAILLVALASSLPPTLPGTDRPSPPVSGAADATPSPDGQVVLGDGDRAVGEGYIVLEAGTTTPVLCDLEVGPLPAGAQITCSGPRVPLSGVELSELPEWSDVNGSWRSSRVEIVGSWRDGELFVDLVRPEAEPLIDNRVPCEAPAEGWTRAADADAAESASRRLSEEVERHPSTYSGAWTAFARGGQPVVVVGTVDDVNATRERLNTIYPYALCVVSVPYSRVDLVSAADDLSAASEDWRVAIDASVGRVRVRIGVVDEAAKRAIEPYGSIVLLDPLVLPLEG